MTTGSFYMGLVFFKEFYKTGSDLSHEIHPFLDPQNLLLKSHHKEVTMSLKTGVRKLSSFVSSSPLQLETKIPAVSDVTDSPG